MDKQLGAFGYEFHYEQDVKRWAAFKTKDKAIYLDKEDRIKKGVLYSNSYITLYNFISRRYG